jgi:hypothetical protein
MANVRIPLSKKLLNDLAEDLELHDSPPSGPTLLLEWKVPQMPKKLIGEIRSDEHPPPHFHVMYDREDASFSILDGKRLPGVSGLERYDRVIWKWWNRNERELCLTWNKSRPTDCTVGPVPVPASPQSK